MKSIKKAIMILALAFGFVAMVPVATVSAVNPVEDACAIDPNSVLCKNKNDSAGDLVKTVVNVLLYVIGIISVIMIIIGGIMYATSGGDSGKVTKAKDTILYAVIGLVVALLAYAIVNWVVGLFTKEPEPKSLGSSLHLTNDDHSAIT